MSVTTVYIEHELYIYIAWAPCRHILLNKYDCHIAYVRQASNILNGYIDWIFLHICAKTQPTAINTSHVIAKYVLVTGIPTKLGIYNIYAKYFINLYGKCIHIYMPHMKWVQSTKWQWALYTYFTCITEQICLPHCTYMFKWTVTIVHLPTPHY